jgi:hypothetical protein
MHAPDEFMKRAAECERMAKVTCDPQSKATWRRMAERWTLCAKLATRDILAATAMGSEANRHRKPTPPLHH